MKTVRESKNCGTQPHVVYMFIFQCYCVVFYMIKDNYNFSNVHVQNTLCVCMHVVMYMVAMLTLVLVVLLSNNQCLTSNSFVQYHLLDSFRAEWQNTLMTRPR